MPSGTVKLSEISKDAQIEKPVNIYEKLSRIQCELKAPKNQYNKFGKYNYRNCEDILEGAKPICNKHRATLVVTDSIEVVEGRFYVMATATLHDWDSDSEISNKAYAREAENKTGMDVSQVTGASSSYARKYALNGLFCIDDTKDADTDAYKEQTQRGQPQINQQPKIIEELTTEWSNNRRRMDELGIDYRSDEVTQWIYNHTGVTNHGACEDIETMKKINSAYKALIKGQLDRLQKQREQNAAAA